MSSGGGRVAPFEGEVCAAPSLQSPVSSPRATVLPGHPGAGAHWELRTSELPPQRGRGFLPLLADVPLRDGLENAPDLGGNGHVHADRLRLPAIAAPMTTVSTPELVIGAARRGVIGAFPTHNAATPAELETWMRRFATELDGIAAPVAPNLVVHRSNGRRDADLAVLERHRVELVITSVGSPKPVIGPLHDIGARVFADVASLTQADRAVTAGADGLVLLTAGAGGQTGWANPFAFVRAVRARFDGPIVLAGGISDGQSILAAQALGADLVYLGTRFIATHQSGAGDDYRGEVDR